MGPSPKSGLDCPAMTSLVMLIPGHFFGLGNDVLFFFD